MTAATRDIIGADALNKIKKGVRIVNCARGGLVDELALAAARRLTCLCGNQRPIIYCLLFDAVVATPHLGASNVEAQEKWLFRWPNR